VELHVANFILFFSKLYVFNEIDPSKKIYFQFCPTHI
jgi:hypothetical protein